MRASNLSARSCRCSFVVAAACGVAAPACGPTEPRHTFGDAWVPPADSLGHLGEDGPGDTGGDDASGASEGPAADDGNGGQPPPDPDPGNVDGATDEGGVDGSGSDDQASADGDTGPPQSPYVGGWDIGDCQDSTTATGTNVGNVLPDFNLLDQHGDIVRLYDFCHKAVWLIEGAFW